MVDEMPALRKLLRPKVVIPVILSVAVLAALLFFGNIKRVIGLMEGFDRLYLVWVGLTFGIPFAVGYGLGGTRLGLEALVWGGLIRIFLYQHATFAVNSICHMFGRRDYRARDESRNNWFVAALVFGEGWHNNHHAFPSSARHGLAWWQYDLSWWVIRGLEKIGLAWDVKLPTAEQIRRRRAVSAQG